MTEFTNDAAVLDATRRCADVTGHPFGDWIFAVTRWRNAGHDPVWLADFIEDTPQVGPQWVDAMIHLINSQPPTFHVEHRRRGTVDHPS